MASRSCTTPAPFVVRLMYSGRDFVWLSEHCDQLAFLDGHVCAFTHFGSVPERLFNPVSYSSPIPTQRTRPSNGRESTGDRTGHGTPPLRPAVWRSVVSSS